MIESHYYFRFFDEVDDRIDENYNNPKYDVIESLLSKSRYENIIGLYNQRYLVNIISGKTPKGVRYLDNGVPFLGSTQILFGKIELDDAPKISREIHESVLASSQIKEGNVLITIAGTIGRCAVYMDSMDCNANQAVAILHINKEEVEPDFLTHYLNSRLGQLFFGKLQHISSQPNINLEEIKKIKVILPKKTEQKEIMNKIRAIESQAIQLESGTTNIRKEAESLLLEELKIEKPVYEMRNYFFKSGAEKRTLCFSVMPDEMSDRLNYLFYHFKHLPLKTLQEKYAIEKLGDVCAEPINRGEQPEYEENGEITVIKTVNLKNSNIDYESCLKVSRAFFDKHSTTHVRKGDILIASTGYVSMGKVDVYDSSEPAMVDGHISIIRLKDGYDPYFIAYFLRSHLGRIQFEKWFSGSSGQIEIQPEDLNQFIVPRSSKEGVHLKKQQEIAREITKKLKETYELEEKTREKWKEARNTFERLILKEI